MDLRAINELDIKDVLSFYGVHLNRKGAACCPFHSEKTASFKVHNNHFTCFGCGVYGDSIDFVTKYFGLDFQQAVIKLGSDFNLNITSHKPTHRDRLRAAENRRIRNAKKEWDSSIKMNYDRLSDAHRALYNFMVTNNAEWIKPLTDAIEADLDDFTGEGARKWTTRL